MSIVPSRAPRKEYRQPFQTIEIRPDPKSPGKFIHDEIVNLKTREGSVTQFNKDDFNWAMNSGYSDQCFMHPNGGGRFYVQTTHPGQPGLTFPFARIIASRRGALGRGHVRFLDGNPLNLRSSNLVVTIDAAFPER
jgi:hypothetical protein